VWRVLKKVGRWVVLVGVKAALMVEMMVEMKAAWRVALMVEMMVQYSVAWMVDLYHNIGNR
jgi:hypothetical protein